MLTLPGTGTKMNTEPISGGTHDTEHNQGVFLANADGSRITPTVDANNRLLVTPHSTLASASGSMTVGVHTYSAGFQVGAPIQLATAISFGVYDVTATVYDFFGVLASTATLWLFGSNVTASLGGDGTSWDGTASGATNNLIGPVTGFTAAPLSTAAPTKKVLVNGHLHSPLVGAVWGVLVDGSGLVAAGTETIFISLMATQVG